MKTVIITGAAGNLGQVVTNRYLDEGYKVLATVTSARSASRLPAHANLVVETLDLADETAARAFIQSAINNHGPVDAALMLAGGFAMGGLAETGLDALHQQYLLNFGTAYNLCRSLFDHMRQCNYGRLVFIGARPALQPAAGKGMIAYTLSKSLLFTLAEILNAEAKGSNVTASVVVPSIIDTPANRKDMPGADTTQWVQPSDIADVLAFITSASGNALRDNVIKVYNNA